MFEPVSRVRHCRRAIGREMIAGFAVQGNPGETKRILVRVQGPNLAQQYGVAGVMPELTLVLDLAPEVGLSRAKARNLDAGAQDSEGRFETKQSRRYCAQLKGNGAGSYFSESGPGEDWWKSLRPIGETWT